MTGDSNFGSQVYALRHLGSRRQATVLARAFSTARFLTGRQGKSRLQMWRDTRGRAVGRRANRIVGQLQGGALRLIRYVMLT
jgi:hypothetical protein